jgi:hypothetical protein
MTTNTETKQSVSLEVMSKDICLLISAIEHYQEELANKSKKADDSNVRRYDRLDAIRSRLLSF